MYKLITLNFCLAVLLLACRKDNEGKIKANAFEAKLRFASQTANQLFEDRKRDLEKRGELATVANLDESFMDDDEAHQIIQPLIDPSAAFLQDYYEINVYNYFPSGSPNIARLGAIGLRLKQLEEQGMAIDTNQIDVWFPTTDLISSPNHEILTIADDGGDIIDCALDALGIPAGLLVGSAKSLSRAALLKAARKLLTRTIGWIGVGIAIYEFGDCMDWW